MGVLGQIVVPILDREDREIVRSARPVNNRKGYLVSGRVGVIQQGNVQKQIVLELVPARIVLDDKSERVHRELLLINDKFDDSATLVDGFTTCVADLVL